MNANWQDTLGQGYAPMSYSHLEKKDFNRVLKTIANWKSPGPDLIHGFWIKK